MRSERLLRSRDGFTLLETMIAMAIMMVAFSSILMVQSSSINTSAKAKQMNVVAMLSRNLLIETEGLIETKKFEEIRSEEKGQFPDPYQDYTWTREVKEVTLPDLSALFAPPEGGAADPAAGGQSTELLGKLVTNYLSKAVREVIVTITWKRGDGTQNFAVSMYWVDLNSAFQLSL